MSSKTEQEKTVETAAEGNPNDSLFIKLHSPYEFEGKQYKSIDLRGLRDWTCNDVVQLTKQFTRATGGTDDPMNAILPEANPEYVEYAAAKATGLPLEFFKNLPAQESGKLKVAIISFFHPAD